MCQDHIYFGYIDHIEKFNGLKFFDIWFTNVCQFLVGFYAHGEAERIELLGWLNTLTLTKTGNDLIYNVGTNYIIVDFLNMIFDTAQSDGILVESEPFDTADLESDGGVVESEPKSEERDSKRAKSDGPKSD